MSWIFNDISETLDIEEIKKGCDEVQSSCFKFIVRVSFIENIGNRKIRLSHVDWPKCTTTISTNSHSPFQSFIVSYKKNDPKLCYRFEIRLNSIREERDSRATNIYMIYVDPLCTAISRNGCRTDRFRLMVVPCIIQKETSGGRLYIYIYIKNEQRHVDIIETLLSGQSGHTHVCCLPNKQMVNI